jgi:hypothetical protein
MQVDISDVTSQAASAVDEEQAAFASTLAVHLNLPAEMSQILAQGSLFQGPSGMECRVRLARDDHGVLAQAELVLPLSALELAGEEVLRLLTTQAWVFGEMGWWLGASEKGVLQLTSMHWLAEPEAVVTALNLMHLMGPQVVRNISFGDDES